MAAGGEASEILRTQLFVNDNVLASFLVATVLVAASLWKESKIIYTIISAILILALWMSQSTLAIVSLGVVSISILNGKKLKWIFVTLIFAVGSVMLFKSPWLIDSFSNRIHWWKTSIELIKLAPWFGHGPGSFEFARTFAHEQGTAHSVFAHSFPLQTAAEIGIPGFLFLAVWITLTISTMTDRHVLASVFALILHGMFDFTLNLHGIFILLVILLALGQSRPVYDPQRP